MPSALWDADIQLIIAMYIARYATNMAWDIFGVVRKSIGRALREAGLELDQKGSIIVQDLAYAEHFNRHRNILRLQSHVLEISPSAYIAANATLFGDVFVGANSYFAFGSVARGDSSAIRVGAHTKIGEDTVLQCNVIGADLAFPLSTNIGNNVTIEHGCKLMSCIVDDDVHIGHRTVIMEGCQLERGCVIAPNSYVPAGNRIPAYTLWAGSPVQYVKQIPAEERQELSSQQKEQSVLLQS